ncbi:hypothetical protein [Sinorhizobium meliloti]|uniref:hypothetical protein n=1 Tax=Rhizobium meliloti TaxID=382 RepID=UPI0012967BC3|nr:hypothetical protein [Sinorhizobium meliloti]MQW59653.1 hypothetical protein [Sinorhizobium meliloti]MQX93138.1 hypothetical protein [Sinorhizobium meliloti]
MDRFAPHLRRILFSLGPMSRLDYLVSKLALIAATGATFWSLRPAGESLLGIACLIAIGVCALSFSLRRLKDLGVANVNAAFMFLFGATVASNALAQVSPASGIAGGVLLLAFLLLTPTATKS